MLSLPSNDPRNLLLLESLDEEEEPEQAEKEEEEEEEKEEEEEEEEEDVIGIEVGGRESGKERERGREGESSGVCVGTVMRGGIPPNG